MNGLQYTINNDSSCVGIKRSEYPTMSATITHASPLFLDAVRRVSETGQWERLPDSEMKIADMITIPKSPFVMYRSDNPPPDDWFKQ